LPTAGSDFLAGLKPPPGADSAPRFDMGWQAADENATPFLSYVGGGEVNWSGDLEELHEESSRDHFIDVWTRRAMLERLGELPAEPTIADLGCSSGYLLADLRRAYPSAFLAGIDMVPDGLVRAHELVPSAALLLADICRLPFADRSVDAVVSANVLEHVPDDAAALSEIRRVLAPGGRAVIVVPAGPGLYDYYDRFLGHERRYARGELAQRARGAGLDVEFDAFLGAPLYPAFWATKKLNRIRYRDVPQARLKELVSSAIARTGNSRLGFLACDLERALLKRGIKLPAGIRGLTVVRRPPGDGR
jgi:SAM-dependent methyltransferase